MLRRLPFKEVTNMRDLGGYPISLNKSTKWKVFLRSDSLNSLTKNEIIFLKKYGLKHVIDMRSSMELEKYPNPFTDDSIVTFHRCSLNTTNFSNISPDTKLSEIYKIILNDKNFINRVFNILGNEKGLTIFHCSAGKDRTGVVSALLLLLAGVYRQDIINDYQQSYTNILNSSTIKKMELKESYINLLKSEAKTIEIVLDLIDNKYGKIEEYLYSCNVDNNLQEKILKKLI